MRRLLGLLLALPIPAMAAEGMPQLDFANPLTIAQVVWMALILVVLYILLQGWALPMVGSVLAERDATIRADLEASVAAKARADQAVAELTQATAVARSQAQSSINAAVDAAKAEAGARSAEQNARLDRQLAEAEQRIAAARAQAMTALREVATQTTREVIGRLAGAQVEDSAIQAAVGGALASRGLA